MERAAAQLWPAVAVVVSLILTRGFPMHRTITAAAFLLLLLSLLACGVLPSGKPNPSAPRGAGEGELGEVCQETRQEIDEWEREERRKLEDDIVEGKVTLLGVAIMAERIEEEANEMTDELSDVCGDEYDRRYGPPPTTPVLPSQSNPLPTPTPRR